MDKTEFGHSLKKVTTLRLSIKEFNEKANGHERMARKYRRKARQLEGNLVELVEGLFLDIYKILPTEEKGGDNYGI